MTELFISGFITGGAVMLAVFVLIRLMGEWEND